jgi:hypothetical protein
MAKKRPDPVVTPAGIASYPYLNRPDNAVWNNGVKVGEDAAKGKYKVTLKLKKGDPEVEAFIQMLKTKYDEAVKAEYDRMCGVAKEKGKKVEVLFDKFFDNDGKFKRAKYPFSTDKDDESLYSLNFSMNAQYKKKDTEEVVKLSPGLWTATAKPWPKEQVIGGGSRVKVSFNPNPFSMAGTGAGLSLQLVAVQVLKLEQFTRSAADAGFKAEASGEDPTADSEGSADGFQADAGGEPPPHDDSDAPPSGARREF